jgi:hypothetical protein
MAVVVLIEYNANDSQISIQISTTAAVYTLSLPPFGERASARFSPPD